MVVSFIDALRPGHGVEPIRATLPIAPSTYYQHKARQADPRRLPERAEHDAVLRPDIQRVWVDNFQVYGVRKVWRQLNRDGIEVCDEVSCCSVCLFSVATASVLFHKDSVCG
jgi:hypothetical protein